MDIYKAINKYVTAGYSEDDAILKVAQDIVLLKIGNSKYSKNITVRWKYAWKWIKRYTYKINKYFK